MNFPSTNPISKDAFANAVIKAIKDAGETQTLRYDAEGFCIVIEEDGADLLNLGNAYGEYCGAAPEIRDGIVQRFVRVWFARNSEVPDDYQTAAPHLLPAVRNRGYFEMTKLELERRGIDRPDFPLTILAEHFAVGLVYDLPESIHQIQPSYLETWQVSFEEASIRARANLVAISQEKLGSIIPGVWQSPWRDNHDSARMLLHEYLRQHQVHGDLVVMIPNRDTLLLTGADDETGLSAIAALAEEALQGPRPMNGIALRLDGDAWVPFMPAPEHPDFAKYQLMWVQAIGQDYEEQKELLNDIYETKDEDIFVASFSARQDQETGEVRSYSVWSKDVVSLLPRTDEVFFFVADGENIGEAVARANWSRVVEVAGALLKAKGWYPERYYVDQFPSTAQIELLRVEE